MPSRAPAATAAAAPRGGDGGAARTTTDDHLRAKAAELERDFAGYKRRLAERRAHAAAAEVVAGGRAEAERRGGDDDAAAAGRGRRYQEYMRRRDERLRHEWRARMERKEAEMQALWARLDRAGSRGCRGGDGGELAAATASSNAGEDHGNLRQKPGNLEVKVRPTAPVTPRCGVPSSPATKLSRPRTSVPPSPAAAAASPRLSTSDPRRRPSHLHREQPQAAEPPATPRKENRLPPPPPSTATAAASPATPRPRTTLSRSRSLFKDRGSSAVTARESPRPPRLQAPRSSYDSAASSVREPAPLPPHADAVAVARSNTCSDSHAHAVLGDLKKASAVAPEPFRLGRSGNGGVETQSPPQVIPRDETDRSVVAPAGDGNGFRKNNQEHVDQSSDKVGSGEITGDSDTEPSYVYIKKHSGEQTPRPCQASAGLGTCPGAEPRSDNKDSDDNVDDTMESTGSNDVTGESPLTDTEDTSRRESSESLYSNVQSSFSPRSEVDTLAADSPLPSATEQSPESYTSPRPRKKPEVEDAKKSLPMPTTPGSVTVSVTVQSATPVDAVSGLKRFLTFGKKNSKGSEAAVAVVERTPGSMVPSTPPGVGCTSGEWSAGDSVKARLESSDAASADDLDSSYVISPHVRPLQSFVPSYPANPGLKEPALHAQSSRVQRSFFSFSSFKSRAI